MMEGRIKRGQRKDLNRFAEARSSWVWTEETAVRREGGRIACAVIPGSVAKEGRQRKGRHRERSRMKKLGRGASCHQRSISFM